MRSAEHSHSEEEFSNTHSSNGNASPIDVIVQSINRRFDLYQRRRTAITPLSSPGDATAIPLTPRPIMGDGSLRANPTSSRPSCPTQSSPFEPIVVPHPHPTPYWEERELYIAAEDLCCYLNGGINYRVLCHQYRCALDVLLTLVKEDLKLFKTNGVDILPSGSMLSLLGKLQTLIKESKALLSDAGVNLPVGLSSVLDQLSRVGGVERDEKSASQHPHSSSGRGSQMQSPPSVSVGAPKAFYITSSNAQWSPKAATPDEGGEGLGSSLGKPPAHPLIMRRGPPAEYTTIDEIATHRMAPLKPVQGSIDNIANVSNGTAPMDDTHDSGLPHLTASYSESYSFLTNTQPTPEAVTGPRSDTAEKSSGFSYTIPASSSPSRADSMVSLALPLDTEYPPQRNRLRQLQELYGKEYYLDGMSLLLDVLGIVYTNEYDQKDRGSAEDVFKTFKTDAQSRMAPVLETSTMLKQYTTDLTPLRSTYLADCLAFRVRPNSTLIDHLKRMEDRTPETLMLSGLQLGDAAVASLMENVIPRLYRLRYLDLSGNDLHDGVLSNLLQAVRYHPALERINLSQNYITDHGVVYLLRMAQTVPKLKEIWVQGCLMRPSSRHMIQTELSHPGTYPVAAFYAADLHRSHTNSLGSTDKFMHQQPALQAIRGTVSAGSRPSSTDFSHGTFKPSPHSSSAGVSGERCMSTPIPALQQLHKAPSSSPTTTNRPSSGRNHLLPISKSRVASSKTPHPPNKPRGDMK